jgi:hypothetical protein
MEETKERGYMVMDRRSWDGQEEELWRGQDLGARWRVGERHLEDDCEEDEAGGAAWWNEKETRL